MARKRKRLFISHRHQNNNNTTKKVNNRKVTDLTDPNYIKMLQTSFFVKKVNSHDINPATDTKCPRVRQNSEVLFETEHLLLDLHAAELASEENFGTDDKQEALEKFLALINKTQYENAFTADT